MKLVFAEKGERALPFAGRAGVLARPSPTRGEDVHAAAFNAHLRERSSRGLAADGPGYHDRRPPLARRRKAAMLERSGIDAAACSCASADSGVGSPAFRDPHPPFSPSSHVRAAATLWLACLAVLPLSACFETVSIRGAAAPVPVRRGADELELLLLVSRDAIRAPRRRGTRSTPTSIRKRMLSSRDLIVLGNWPLVLDLARLCGTRRAPKADPQGPLMAAPARVALSRWRHPKSAPSAWVRGSP
jgi:hypothetical protein